MRLIIIAFIVCIFTFNCFATEYSLRALAGVKVRCRTSQDIKDIGLETKDIQNNVEIMLRNYNINVLSEYNDKTQGGELDIVVNGFCMRSNYGTIDRYFCIVTLTINELATLLPDNTKTNESRINLVQTWGTNNAVSGNINNMKKASMESIESVVKVFSMKYLEHNQL